MFCKSTSDSIITVGFHCLSGSSFVQISLGSLLRELNFLVLVLNVHIFSSVCLKLALNISFLSGEFHAIFLQRATTNLYNGVIKETPKTFTVVSAKCSQRLRISYSFLSNLTFHFFFQVKYVLISSVFNFLNETPSADIIVIILKRILFCTSQTWFSFIKNLKTLSTKSGPKGTWNSSKNGTFISDDISTTEISGDCMIKYIYKNRLYIQIYYIKSILFFILTILNNIAFILKKYHVKQKFYFLWIRLLFPHLTYPYRQILLSLLPAAVEIRYTKEFHPDSYNCFAKSDSLKYL